MDSLLRLGKYNSELLVEIKEDIKKQASSGEVIRKSDINNLKDKYTAKSQQSYVDLITKQKEQEQSK